MVWIVILLVIPELDFLTLSLRGEANPGHSDKVLILISWMHRRGQDLVQALFSPPSPFHRPRRSYPPS